MFLIEDVEYKRIQGGCMENHQNQKPSDVVYRWQRPRLPRRLDIACPSYPRKVEPGEENAWRWLQPRPFYL